MCGPGALLYYTMHGPLLYSLHFAKHLAKCVVLRRNSVDGPLKSECISGVYSNQPSEFHNFSLVTNSG